MKHWIVILVAAASLTGTHAYAQEAGFGPGTAELTAIPGGGMFFVDSDTESSFGNYNLGGAFTYNINRLIGIEGELGGTLGITQDLAAGGLTSTSKTPNTLAYSGNLVLSTPARRRIVRYAAVGIGGLTLFKDTALAIDSKTTFLTGNVGGGVKWYINERMGLRGDYRFTAVRSSDTAPAFFGQETRYAHRIYGGLVVNLAP